MRHAALVVGAVMALAALLTAALWFGLPAFRGP
jgi:hypothetical protein